MFNKKIGFVAAVILVVTISLGLNNYSAIAEEHEFIIGEGTQFIGDIGRMSPEDAVERGIHGYLSLSCDDVSKNIVIQKGSETVIPIILEYISFDDEISSIVVNIDPMNEYGLFIEQMLGKDKPSVLLNDLVTFDVTGEITLKAGQKYIVRATVKIPHDSLDYTIPFGGIGISTNDVGMRDSIKVKLDVQ